MKPHNLSIVALVLMALSSSILGQELREERVTFEKGESQTSVADQVTGREAVVYKLKARDGQFLSVRLSSENPQTEFSIYIPGRGPGDEALFASALGGKEYIGQLYKTGDHGISVFLNRAAARRGEVARYEISFDVTDEKPEPSVATSPSPAGASGKEEAWSRVSFVKADHAELLQRQGKLPAEISTQPVAVAVAVLAPDASGVVTSVTASYDTMENPSEVEVTVTEGGILDDDLIGVRQIVSLAMNRNKVWRIVGCSRGELRRIHMR